jgi:superfamily II DNA/RNA helicase
MIKDVTAQFLPFYGIRPSNMIAQSQSGTGKTAAFSLTMLSRIAYGQEIPQVRRYHPLD